MQRVDSKLHIANMSGLRPAGFSAKPERGCNPVGRAHAQTDGCNLISRLKGTSSSERVLAMLLSAFVVTASPALLATVHSTVSISLQILLQVAHVGFIAFQIFGR